jgi:hypothetical protein
MTIQIVLMMLRATVPVGYSVLSKVKLQGNTFDNLRKEGRLIITRDKLKWIRLVK